MENENNIFDHTDLPPLNMSPQMMMHHYSNIYNVYIITLIEVILVCVNITIDDIFFKHKNLGQWSGFPLSFDDVMWID